MRSASAKTWATDGKGVCPSSPLRAREAQTACIIYAPREAEKIGIENSLVALSACVCMKYSAQTPRPAACQGSGAPHLLALQSETMTAHKKYIYVTAARCNRDHFRSTARMKRCSEVSSIFKPRMRHIKTQLLMAPCLALPQ